MEAKTPDSSACRRCEPAPPRRSPAASLLGGVLIAVLPKCPFCVLAYSSAVTMCSGATMYDHQPGWFSFVSVALALVVTGTIVRNYRGPRSGLALLLALAGTAAVGYSELYSGQLPHYYLGAYLLLGGALLNGGLPALLRSGARRLRQRAYGLPAAGKSE